ncbi:unnamed protein product, partial [Adineta steineri]
GSWTRAMLELIDELEPNNVYLTIFENNSTDVTSQLLQDFKKHVKCMHKIVTTKLILNDDQKASMYMKDTMHKRLSRIPYLAMVRNHALAPILHNKIHMSTNESRRFSKVLFLNDIAFFSQDATRDTDGYSMGQKLLI